MWVTGEPRRTQQFGRARNQRICSAGGANKICRCATHHRSALHRFERVGHFAQREQARNHDLVNLTALRLATFTRAMLRRIAMLGVAAQRLPNRRRSLQLSGCIINLALHVDDPLQGFALPLARIVAISISLHRLVPQLKHAQAPRRGRAQPVPHPCERFGGPGCPCHAVRA
jgi:hypothetical protein